MKRYFLIFLAVLLLSGCGVGENAPGTVNVPLTTDTTETITCAESADSSPLSSPPLMSLENDQNRIPIPYSTGSWNYEMEDGTTSGFIACGAHPLYHVQMEQYPVTGSYLQINFSHQPDHITVTRWSGEDLGDLDAQGEVLDVKDGRFDLLSGDYIYEVNAVWDDCGRGYHGNVSYCFYLVSDHSHSLAKTPMLIEDPVSGYCGNTVTTVYLDGKEYSFMYDDSVTLTDILINLAYDPEKVCDCMAEFRVDTEFGTGYRVNLTEGYARCEAGQAELTAEQVETIRKIIDNLS